MNLKIRRILLIVTETVSAAAMVAAGIGVIVNHAGTDAMLKAWIGAMILLSGLSQLPAIQLRHKSVFAGHGFIMRAAITAAAGLFVLLKVLFAADVLRVLLSMMVVMNGVQLIDAATALRRRQAKEHLEVGLLAVLELIMGILGFLRPGLLFGEEIGIVLGISLIADGLVTAAIGLLSLRWFNRVRRLISAG